MDSPGHHFLARTGLADEEHGVICPIHHFHSGLDGLDGLALAHDGEQGSRASPGLTRLCWAAMGPHEIHRLTHCIEHFAVVQRLEQVAEGPRAHHLPGMFRGAEAGDHDHRRAGIRLPCLPQHLLPRDVGHSVVQKHQIRSWRSEVNHLQGHPAVGGLNDLQALAIQQGSQCPTYIRVVVHNEHLTMQGIHESLGEICDSSCE